jgi:hypothetical protein
MDKIVPTRGSVCAYVLSLSLALIKTWGVSSNFFPQALSLSNSTPRSRVKSLYKSKAAVGSLVSVQIFRCRQIHRFQNRNCTVHYGMRISPTVPRRLILIGIFYMHKSASGLSSSSNAIVTHTKLLPLSAFKVYFHCQSLSDRDQ